MAKSLKDEVLIAVAAGVAVKLIWDWANSPAGQQFLGPLWPGNLGKPGSLYRPESMPHGTGMPGEGPLEQVKAVKTKVDTSGKDWEDVWWKAVEEVQPEFLTLPGASNLVRMLMTHSAREVGQDTGSMYHYNPGFITTASGQYFLWPESDKVHKYMVFNFPKQGAVYMANMVKEKWPEAWEAGFRGDPRGYAAGLKHGKNGAQWYETSEKTYGDLLQKLWDDRYNPDKGGGQVIPFPAM